MRLWVLSWAARGWQPRILLSGEKCTGCYVTPDSINFSQKPRKGPPFFHVGLFGHYDWKDEAIVRFPDAKTDEDILACGRPLDL